MAISDMQFDNRSCSHLVCKTDKIVEFAIFANWRSKECF